HGTLPQGRDRRGARALAPGRRDHDDPDLAGACRGRDAAPRPRSPRPRPARSLARDAGPALGSRGRELPMSPGAPLLASFLRWEPWGQPGPGPLPAAALVVLFVLGLCLGSFLNVVIHRLPLGR